jgi:hypothetical protein
VVVDFAHDELEELGGQPEQPRHLFSDEK